MGMMGRYCKAYPVHRFRAFAGWSENRANLRKQTATASSQREDGDLLFLQENYVVTDGIYRDEHVIFADVTPEWKSFCQETLRFKTAPEAAGEL
jgi:hypothetical protein